ncbi:MAG TPA: methyltransferase domain-containing protein [Rhodospirillales bacterium]|nr:methyltransferase domain-containing protein [Rhodospirillales bacterium]
MEERVAAHYMREDLATRLLSLLETQGRDPARLRPEDLVGVEDMHVGGRAATERFARSLPLQPGMEILDIGSGLGGAARYLALAYGCRVTGIDLTPALVAAARILSERVGMGDRVRFEEGSALDLSFPDGSFDGAYTIHVGMNVADKRRFYGEAFRVVKPGGFFALYDVVRLTGEPDYPVPWAESPETSHLATPDMLEELLRELGFEVREVIDRTAEGAAAMAESARRIAEPGAAARASAPVVMGNAYRAKIDNIAAALGDRRLGAFEIHCRRP